MCTRPLFAVISLRLEFDFFFCAREEEVPWKEDGRDRWRDVDARETGRIERVGKSRDEVSDRRGRLGRRRAAFRLLSPSLGVCSPKDEKMGIFWIKQN